MISMQYNVKLPAGYDMDIIKRRVRENGFKTDGFRDLEMKAYLIAEKDRHGNTGNEYAPFYLWRGVKGMNDFLLEGPFDNILSSFGWTAVNTWQVLHHAIRPTHLPQYTIVKKTPTRPVSNFSGFLKEQEAFFQRQMETSHITCSISAYNPTIWEVCHFTMSTDLDYLKHHGNGGLIYKLHHLSQAVN